MNLELYHTYNTRYVDAIYAAVDTILFMTRKWKENDYVWPFSDMDYRFVLKADACVDFFALNKNIYRIQLEMQQRDAYYQRILEHPPGYIFFSDEIESYYFEDYRIWSFAGGNEEAFCRFQANLDTCDEFDASYYHKILAKRLGRFTLDTEFANYDSPRLAVYNAYCVLWHYAFPCLFALHSLYRQRSVGCKVNPAWLEDSALKSCFAHMIAGKSAENIPPMETLVKVTTAAVQRTADQLGVVTDTLGISLTKGLPYFEAVAMLRTRIARMHLYLEEDAVNRIYLAKREVVELTSIFESIALHNGSNTDRCACTLLYQNQTAVEKLRVLWNYMLENRSYYNSLMNQRIGRIGNGLLNGKN